MCTVSIVPGRDGFRVMSNRDERRDRAVALHPCVDTLGSGAAVMPIDPVGGGSWIGVNDRGLVAAVLNRHDGRSTTARSFTSRGQLVRRALACDSLDEAMRSVQALDAARFQPFRLVLAQEQHIALVAGDSCQFAHAESTLHQPYLFTASSMGDAFVDAPRRRLFDCFMAQSDRLQGQRRFHGHQWCDKRDISVLMERADAATVSRTVVDVHGHSITLDYESLLPHCGSHSVSIRPC